MDIGTLILVTATAFVAGIVVWLVRGRDVARTRRDYETANVELSSLRKTASDARTETASIGARFEVAQKSVGELEGARQRITDLSVENEGLRTKLDTAEVAHAAQVEQLQQIRQEVQDQFKLLAGDILKASNTEFIERAEGIFKAQKELTAKEIDERSAKIADLVKPLGDLLQSYDVALKDIEKARNESYGGVLKALELVSAQHNDVKTVTANLVNALRASPKTRGRWGEETLRRVMELSGMVEHCDFDTEKHFRGLDESLRPDVLINLAGGRTIIVDAKAPFSAYLDAISAVTEEEREALLQKHASQLRERLTNLSSKSYWEKVEGSPDCVVMFVPGDNFVAAAFERDPDLFEDGINNRVLICTPTTFIALAKALSYGWRQERLAQNAADIARLGKELYARLSTMGGHVAKLSGSLKSSVETFNKFVGSLESNVMPQARRFQELGVEGSTDVLPETAQVEVIVRVPQPDRDLLITDVSEKSE